MSRMEQINIISTSIVQPSNPKTSTDQRIELTPFDLPCLVMTYIQRGFLFLKPTQVQLKELGNDLIPHLKASLSRALDIFPPVAGRIDAVENDDKTTSFFIDCNGSGAQFVHAVANGVTVADILEPKYCSDILFSLFPLTNVYSCEGISKPLLAIQVTELVDGIFITFSCNHAITDGKGFSHLVNTWSEISRSPENITQPLPVLGFPFIDHQIRIPNFSFHEITSNAFLTPTHCLVRIFHFTKDKIAELKAKARTETGTTTISSLQVILGHLWRSVVRNRHFDTDQQVHMWMAVDMRKRLQQLPENYFRNAAVLENATTTAGDLLGHGLGFAALQINKMVSAQTVEASRKKLEGLLKRPQLPKPNADEMGSNSLFVGSSPRFNHYGNDFGWGKPVALRGGTSSDSSMDGLILAFPGSEEGCVDLQVFLAAQTLQAMDNDAEFMQAVST